MFTLLRFVFRLIIELLIVLWLEEREGGNPLKIPTWLRDIFIHLRGPRE